MRHRARTPQWVVAAVGVFLWASLLPAALLGQSEGGGPGAPRTPWGDPDLQGLYNTAWLTPFERTGAKELLTEQEAAALERAAADRRERLARPSDSTRDAPPVGGDGSTGAAGNVGGYNNFWIDNGERYFSVNGRRRASIVVDPPDGRVPPLSEEARRRQQELAQARQASAPTSDAPENVQTRTRGAYDDPELRPLGERCILGFGSTSGPPMLPVLYNNFKQLVQTPDHVMILVEMNHDARIIRLNRPHGPESIRQWLGDSVGRWEGDTLVVETTNFGDKTRYRGSTRGLKVTERFTRVDEGTLLYGFTIDDPATWTRPWSGEYPFVKAAADDHLYEYACHEGNYAFEGILKGERLLETEAAEAYKTSQRP